MLKMIALAAAVVAGVSVAPMPESVAQAGAQQTYRACMRSIDTMCLPQGPLGPILPEAGTPEYEAYIICYEAQAAYCATLPDAP